MTGYELRLWRKGMGWDQERAAEELGKCLRTYKAYEKSPHIDRIVELATRSLSLTLLLPALSEKNSAEICQVLSILDVNYLGRYASTTLAAFELFLS
nr:helix-turn-helix transcriptional regulator [Enterobacter asburiae]